MLDFDGNESVAIKYNVYTLVCEQLLPHMRKLERLLRGHSDLSMRDIHEWADGVLTYVFEKGRPSSVAEAARLAAGELGAKCDTLATVSQPVADILSRVVANVRDRGADWCYRQAVERWQTTGRELAQRFYRGTPYPLTQERLTHEPDLVFQYAGYAGETPFGYRERCWAEDEEPVAGLIVARFSFFDCFCNYLAYPFFFLHEYVSHVYGADTGSQLFEDGWLLSAANDFFRKQVILHGFPGLHAEQIDVFERDILSHMGHRRKAQNGYFMAKRFCTWCNTHLPGRFQAINHELAAFTTETGFPHGAFLYALVESMEAYPDDLLSWLHTTRTCQELWRRLRPIE